MARSKKRVTFSELLQVFEIPAEGLSKKTPPRSSNTVRAVGPGAYTNWETQKSIFLAYVREQVINRGKIGK